MVGQNWANILAFLGKSLISLGNNCGMYTVITTFSVLSPGETICSVYKITCTLMLVRKEVVLGELINVLDLDIHFT